MVKPRLGSCTRTLATLFWGTKVQSTSKSVSPAAGRLDSHKHLFGRSRGQVIDGPHQTLDRTLHLIVDVSARCVLAAQIGPIRDGRSDQQPFGIDCEPRFSTRISYWLVCRIMISPGPW